jgi:glycosyltransferase involved in cell wall biosynthesis
MKIAIFTDTFLPELNGVARTLGRFAAQLDKLGIEYRVWAPGYRRPIDPSPSVIRIPSVAFPLYPECRVAFPNPWRIRRELREFAPDIVHIVTEFNVGVVGFRAARKLGIPIVSSYHTNFSHYTRHYRMQWLESTLWWYLRRFHNRTLATFCPSETTRRELESVGMERVKIWSRGIDGHLFSPAKRDVAWRRELGIDDKVVLIYVGRLGHEKSVELLFDALRLLNERLHDRIHLMLVGDGPLRPKLEREAPRNVTFTGFKRGEDLYRAFASGDIFCFPSVTETFGNVVIEAMASGLPVVAAAQGGPVDIIRHGETGYLFEPANAAALAKHVEELVMDEPARHAMAERAVAYAHTQSWDVIFGKLLDDYREIIAAQAALRS